MVVIIGTYKEGTEGGRELEGWHFDGDGHYPYEELKKLAIAAGTYALVPGDIRDPNPLEHYGTLTEWQKGE